MATRQKHSNNGTSTLLGAFAIAATSCSVQAGHGARFDSPGATEHFLFTLKDAAGNIETCKCTQRTVDTFNVVVRAQEGTTERNWLAGDLVEARLTRDTMARLAQKDAAETITAPWTFSQDITHSVDDTHAGNEKHAGHETFQGRINAANTVGGTVDAITATFVPALTALVDKMRVIARATGANTGAVNFNPDTLGNVLVEKVVGGVRATLAAGDITGASHDLDLVYNAAANRWLLLNPKPVVDLLTQYNEWTLASPMVEATPYSVSHGFGGTPKLLQLVLKCLTAELGYSVGDEVQIVGNVNNTNNNGALSCWASATQVGATTHASGYVHSMTHKTSGAPGNATVGNWALIIRAWK